MNTSSKTYLHVPYGRFLVHVIIVVVLLLACITALCIFDQKRTQSEMGAILSAFFSDQVLHDLRYWPAGREIQIVLLREPQPGPFPGERLLFDPRSSFSQSSRTTRVSFFLSNVFSTDIATELHLPGRAQSFFISRREVQGTKPIDFQTRFPNNFGHFAISHVGLNPSKTEAILYVDHFCGGLCGGGGYYLMRKIDGVWRVVDQHITWMS